MKFEAGDKVMVKRPGRDEFAGTVEDIHSAPGYVKVRDTRYGAVQSYPAEFVSPVTVTAVRFSPLGVELAEHVARRSGRAPKKTNWTRALLRAHAAGKVVVASLLPYDGIEVTYAPRKKGDPKPWSVQDLHGCEWRFNGRECHTAEPCAAPMLKGGRRTACTRPAGHELRSEPGSLVHRA